MAQSHVARLLRTRAGVLDACLFATGHRSPVFPDIDNPVLALGGAIVATLAAPGCEATGSCALAITTRDLQGGHPALDRGVDLGNEGVASLRVTAGGVVVWVTCEPADGGTNACAPTEVRHVRATHLATGRTETLGSGRGIAPRSLAVRSGRVTWLQHGRRRSQRTS